MIVRIAALALVLGLARDSLGPVPRGGNPAPPGASLDDKEALLAAAKRAADVKSCTFRGETKLDLPEGVARGAGAEAARFEGKFERGAGTWVKTDAHEFLTAGGKTVARPISDWKLLKEEDPGDVQRLIYQSLGSARALRSPPEEFAGYARGVERVKKSDAKETVGDKECAIYEAEFTEPAARDLGRALVPMGRWVDRLPNAACSASARVWVDGEGRILKVESKARIAATIQGSDVQLSATRTTAISDIDATKVEVPDGAKKILDLK